MCTIYLYAENFGNFWNFPYISGENCKKCKIPQEGASPMCLEEFCIVLAFYPKLYQKIQK